ncbi:MAG: NTP transferase domain-containing protein [Anaerolineaceae bacterium]|nr:NTP transferase domain-containing protein [Anaerolineaceae bacterium]
MKAVVLAGGKGTRLAPYTTILPKPLMPIGEMPILEILIHQMNHAGVDEIILTVGHLASLLEAFFQDGSKFNVKIGYSMEDHPLGTAGPLSLIDGLDSTFVVTNGDILTTLDMKELIDFHKSTHAVATIAMHHRKIKINLGVIEHDSQFQVVDYLEKPEIDYTVSMGMYVFEPEVLNFIPKNKYLDFPELVKILLKNEKKVVGYQFDGYWQDLGNPEDYQQAMIEFTHMRSQILKEA